MKVFNIFEVGDIAVSTINLVTTRKVGDMFVVSDGSGSDNLYYTNHGGSRCVSSDKKSWRVATPSEQEYYRIGGRNTNIKPKSDFTNYEIY